MPQLTNQVRVSTKGFQPAHAWHASDGCISTVALHVRLSSCCPAGTLPANADLPATNFYVLPQTENGFCGEVSGSSSWGLMGTHSMRYLVNALGLQETGLSRCLVLCGLPAVHRTLGVRGRASTVFIMVARRDQGMRGISWQGWMQVVLWPD